MFPAQASRRRRPVSGALDTQTVTTGSSGTAGTRFRGFSSSGPAIGSVSDGTSDLFSGAAVQGLYWDEAGAKIKFIVNGTQANSGFSTMSIDGTTSLSRASATFTQSGGVTTWSWDVSAAGYVATTQPFGAAATVHTVTFA